MGRSHTGSPLFDFTLLPLDGTAQGRILSKGRPRALATSEGEGIKEKKGRKKPTPFRPPGTSLAQPRLLPLARSYEVNFV